MAEINDRENTENTVKAVLGSDRSRWRRVKFGQMAECVTDRVDNPAESGVERYVGLDHLDPGTLSIRRWGAPTDVESTKLRFKLGDVIFGKRRAYQRKLAVADFEGICSAHAMVLRAHEKTVYPSFLPVFMQSDVFFDRALQISVGSLSPTINWKALAVQEFDLPPLDEQRRIAEMLWAIETAKTKSIAILVDLASLRQSLLMNSLDAYPNMRFSTVVKNLTAGKSISAKNKASSPSNFGVIKISAIGPGKFIPSENKELFQDSDFLAQYSICKNDLLISRCNTADLVGMCCVVHKDYPNLMLCDKTIRIELDNEIADFKFINEVLLSRKTRLQIEAAASGTSASMKNITQLSILSLTLPIPPLGIQRELVSKLDQVENNQNQVADRID